MHMRALLLAALLVLAPAAALAAPATPVPPAASSVQREQALIERLTIERANALAANDARWASQYADRARRLEAAEKALRAAQSTNAAELARLTAEKKALADEIAHTEKTLTTAAGELTALGLTLADPASGQVDFPTKINGRSAAFTWKHGEDQLGHWRYAGEELRRPIPADWQSGTPIRLRAEP
jgi:hypothetical protein